MGLLDRFLGPPGKDKFAKLIMRRLESAGVSGPLEYDRSNFSIKQPDEKLYFLDNIYAEYCRVPKSDRELVLTTYMRGWVTQAEIPSDFQDAKHDLLPALRARAYFELDLRFAAPTYSLENHPYQIVAEDLCLSVVYDLPSSMMTVNQEQLDDWGVTLYEALEAAKQNLQERTTSYAQIGTLYAMTHGDSYDATRLVLTELIGEMGINGDVIAMAPNRESLFLASADDQEALESMLKLAEEGLQHERFISGIALKLADGVWEPWLPDASHPLYQQFAQLRLQTIGQQYERQRELLQTKSQQEGKDVYVGEFSAVQRNATGEFSSYAVWTSGIPTLLPRTDLVMLAGYDANGSIVKLASGTWEEVHRIAGHLMQSQETYPERYFVESFPTSNELQQIGDVLS